MYKEKEKYLGEDMIHPNEEGVKLLGSAVSNAILNCHVTKNNHSEDRVQQIEFNEKTIQ